MILSVNNPCWYSSQLCLLIVMGLEATCCNPSTVLPELEKIVVDKDMLERSLDAFK